MWSFLLFKFLFFERQYFVSLGHNRWITNYEPTFNYGFLLCCSLLQRHMLDPQNDTFLQSPSAKTQMWNLMLFVTNWVREWSKASSVLHTRCFYVRFPHTLIDVYTHSASHAVEGKKIIFGESIAMRDSTIYSAFQLPTNKTRGMMHKRGTLNHWAKLLSE